MEFSTIGSLRGSNLTKREKILLNLERFGLLPENVQNDISAERQAGNLPAPMEPIDEEGFQAIKELITMFAGPKVAGTDEQIAQLFYTLEGTGDFITSKDFLKEAGALVGGVVAPSFIPGPGQVTAPARVAAFLEKYPRYSKVIGAFLGGATGSAPFSDSYLEALGYGAREAFGEGAFQVLHKFFPFLKDMVKGEAGEALEAGAKSGQKILSDQGATLTPARISRNPNVDLIEQLAETSFFGANLMRKGTDKAQEISQKSFLKYLGNEYFPNAGEISLVDNFINKASQENVDDLLKNFLLDGRDFYAGAVDGAYKNLNKVSRGLLKTNKIVDVTKLLKSFDRQIKNNTGSLQAGLQDPSVRAIRNYIQEFAETGKGGVDFLTAKTIRSWLLGKTGYYTTSGTNPPKYLEKVAGDMANYMTKLMQDSVNAQIKSGRLGKEEAAELLNAYKLANNTYKQGKGTFNTKFISQILLGDDTGQVTKATLDAQEQLYSSIFEMGAKPGRAKAFFRLINDGVNKKIITKEGAENIRRKLQGEWFRKTIVDATDDKGVIDPAKIIAATGGRRGKVGQTILNELFEGKDALVLKNMKKYLDSMVLAQSRGIEKQKGSLAFISAQFAGAGAILAPLFSLNLATAGGATLGLATLIGPRMIAKAFTDPKFVDNLLNLETAKVGSNKYARSAIQLINNMVANQFVDPILAKRFVDEAVVEDVFEESDKKKMNWYFDVKDKDLTEPESTTPGLLDLQADFNKPNTAPPGLLDQLNIATLGSEPTTTASVSEAPSMAPLDLGPITTASAPPSQSINPNTLASLESVGLPFFQAKDGGLASIEPKKFKKPQVVS